MRVQPGRPPNEHTRPSPKVRSWWLLLDRNFRIKPGYQAYSQVFWCDAKGTSPGCPTRVTRQRRLRTSCSAVKWVDLQVDRRLICKRLPLRLRLFGCVTQLSELKKTNKCPRYQWAISRSAAPVETAASTHAKRCFRQVTSKGACIPAGHLGKADFHVAGPQRHKSELATIRSSGFPPRNACNSIRRPWSVSRS